MGQEKSRQTFKISQSNVVPSTSESTGKRPKYAGNRVDGTTDSSAVKFPSRPLPERKLSSSTQSDALDTETYADDGDLYESPTTTNGMKVMDNTWEPSSKPSLYDPSTSHENISHSLGSDCPSDGTNESLHTQSIRGFNITPGNNSDRVLDLSAANSNRRSFPLPTLPSSTQRKTKSNEKDPKDENFNVSPPATNKTELVEIESESSAEPPKAFLDDTPATYENTPYPAKIGSTSQQSSPPKESDFGAESVQTPSMRAFRTFHGQGSYINNFALNITNCNVKIIYPLSASEIGEADSTDTNSEFTVICASSRDKSVSNEYVEFGRQVPHGEQPWGSGETVSHQTPDLLQSTKSVE